MLLQKYVGLEINVIGHDNRSDSILLKKHETGHTEDRLLNLNSERNVYDGYVSMTWKHIIIFKKTHKQIYQGCRTKTKNVCGTEVLSSITTSGENVWFLK